MTTETKIYALTDKHREMLLDAFYQYFIAQAPNRDAGKSALIEFAQVEHTFANPIIKQNDLRRGFFIVTKEGRWHTGNKLKVIDRNSPHFGKTGKIVDIKQLPLTILTRKTRRTATVITLKLDDTGEEIKFRDDTLPLIAQLAKVN